MMAQRTLKVAGLFAGIGGIEHGLHVAGHQTEFLCELDPAAQTVLRSRFPDTPLHYDITNLRSIPQVDLVAAGFPCQDLSLAGTQKGLKGERSGLVSHVFRLIEGNPPEFVLLENVLYLMKRKKGALIKYIGRELEELGYRWAYRVVDSRGFGLPQRRQRVIILASLGDVDPAALLLRRQAPAETDDRIVGVEEGRSYGFYWTEGKRAVGWAPDAVPTVKGGSGLSIPSPPAIFTTSTRFTGTPTIEDGERLQGFEPGWTNVELGGKPIREGVRWTLVGNAVSVPVAQWVGDELASWTSGPRPEALALKSGQPMPKAASNNGGGLVGHETSLHVQTPLHVPISGFLNDPLKPLSTRAINGFLYRVRSGVMDLPHAFLSSLERQAVAQAANA
jgi:DNA (cytosine-5)-methyltransferase 1